MRHELSEYVTTSSEEVMPRAIHVFRSPDRFVAGTVGTPGDRTFYLQATHEARVVSVVEKQQVQILAERIGALLEEIHRRFGTPLPPEDDHIEDLRPLTMPVDAEFRVGTMGSRDAESEAVVVELLAITEGDFDESVVLDDTEEGPDAVRVFLSTTAAREFAARSTRVISAGREPCPLCGQPLDATGHMCAHQRVQTRRRVRQVAGLRRPRRLRRPRPARRLEQDPDDDDDPDDPGSARP